MGPNIQYLVLIRKQWYFESKLYFLFIFIFILTLAIEDKEMSPDPNKRQHWEGESTKCDCSNNKIFIYLLFRVIIEYGFKLKLILSNLYMVYGIIVGFSPTIMRSWTEP